MAPADNGIALRLMLARGLFLTCGLLRGNGGPVRGSFWNTRIEDRGERGDTVVDARLWRILVGETCVAILDLLE